MKKILITGGAGFIGYHLAKRLLADPETQLILIDNLQRGKMDEDLTRLVSDPRVRFIEADLTNPGYYSALDSDIQYVYHLAAVNGTKLFYQIPHEVLRINTLSLIYILEWFKTLAQPGKKILFTSSSEVYAGALSAFGTLPIPTPEQVPLVIENPYNPRASYDASKLVGEPFVIHYAQQYNFSAVIVRPHNFYGPRAGYDHVIPEFCQRVSAHTDPFTLFGNDTRTFCYIDDAVRAMQLLMESDKTSGLPVKTVNIGSNDEITIRDLAEHLFTITGWRPTNLVLQPSPEGSVKRRLADVTSLHALTGWQPEVPLEEGLRTTYDWYLKHPNVTGVRFVGGTL